MLFPQEVVECEKVVVVGALGLTAGAIVVKGSRVGKGEHRVGSIGSRGLDESFDLHKLFSLPTSNFKLIPSLPMALNLLISHGLPPGQLVPLRAFRLFLTVPTLPLRIDSFHQLVDLHKEVASLVLQLFLSLDEALAVCLPQ